MHNSFNNLESGVRSLKLSKDFWPEKLFYMPVSINKTNFLNLLKAKIF